MGTLLTQGRASFQQQSPLLASLAPLSTFRVVPEQMGLQEVGDMQEPGPPRGYLGHSDSRLTILGESGQTEERPKPKFAQHRKTQKWR